MKSAFDLLKTTFKEWGEDKAARLAAALAYYTIFSVAPLLVVIIAVVGLVFGRQAVQGQIVGQIQGLVGAQGATQIQDMIRSAGKPSTGILATVIGLVTLLLGASGVFAQLQDSLNTIWEVMPRPGRPLLAVVKDRLLTFGMVLGIGFLLMVALVVTAAISALNGVLGRLVPGLGNAPMIWQLINQVVSFLVITLLFALIFKYLPDVHIRWHDVWMGAAFTSLLFTLGKFAIGLYLGHSSVGSAYGAAGSLVVILLWVYYSAQILFLGAEFTQVYARRDGQPIEPARDTIPLSDEARAHQGIPHVDAGKRRPSDDRLETPGKASAAGAARQPVSILTASQAHPTSVGKARAAAITAAGATVFALVAATRFLRRK